MGMLLNDEPWSLIIILFFSSFITSRAQMGNQPLQSLTSECTNRNSSLYCFLSVTSRVTTLVTIEYQDKIIIIIIINVILTIKFFLRSICQQINKNHICHRIFAGMVGVFVIGKQKADENLMSSFNPCHYQISINNLIAMFVPKFHFHKINLLFIFSSFNMKFFIFHIYSYIFILLKKISYIFIFKFSFLFILII